MRLLHLVGNRKLTEKAGSILIIENLKAHPTVTHFTSSRNAIDTPTNPHLLLMLLPMRILGPIIFKLSHL